MCSTRYCACRELDAFVFVFETANRIVVEEPKFRHATYFFEIEEPLPISCQVTFLMCLTLFKVSGSLWALRFLPLSVTAGVQTGSAAAHVPLQSWQSVVPVQSLHVYCCRCSA